MQKQHIDGSYGEGGGQIIRTSLALSLITGTPIHLTNIRAGRKKSGLLRQHLACVKASKAIGCATVTGDTLGSREITFTPHTVQAGDYEFAIGSAGSTMLVLQTILPALMRLDVPSTISISGGTHNPMAPPVEYIQHTFIPFLARLGFQVKLTCEEAGFAPVGGGRIRCDIEPFQPQPKSALNLTERGELLGIDARVILSHVPFHVAEREFATLENQLSHELANINTAQHVNHENLNERTDTKEPETSAFSKTPVIYNGISQGNMALASVRCEHHTETFSVLGSKKATSEQVGKRLSGHVKRYLHSHAVADEYTADQLLLPLALTGGGTFTARHISEHTRTQAFIIEQFLPVDITLEEKGDIHVICVR